MTVTIVLALLLLSAAGSSSAMADIATDERDPLHAACAAMPGEKPALPGIAVTDEPVEAPIAQGFGPCKTGNIMSPWRERAAAWRMPML